MKTDKQCSNCQFSKVTEAMKNGRNSSIVRYCERYANYMKIWQSCDYFTQKIS